jgi:hypothetical protein
MTDILTSLHQLSPAEYVGLPATDAEAELVLPDTMSAFELDRVVWATSKELRCIGLGMLALDSPKTPADLRDEFGDLGAHTIAAVDPSCVVDNVRQLPQDIVQETGDGFRLTPFGLVVRSVGGHQLQMSRATNTFLASVYGTYRRNYEKTTEEDGTLTSLIRAYLVTVVANNTAKSGINVDVLREEVESMGANRHQFRKFVLKLVNAGLMSEGAVRGEKTLKPTERALEVAPHIGTILAGAANRDTAFYETGSALLEKQLQDTAVLPFLVQRSLVSTNQHKDDKLRQLERDLYGILRESEGPLTVKQILDYLGEQHNNDSLRVSMARLKLQPWSRIGVVRTQGHNQFLWGITQTEKKSPRY